MDLILDEGFLVFCTFEFLLQTGNLRIYLSQGQFFVDHSFPVVVSSNPKFRYFLVEPIDGGLLGLYLGINFIEYVINLLKFVHLYLQLVPESFDL